MGMGNDTGTFLKSLAIPDKFKHTPTISASNDTPRYYSENTAEVNMGWGRERIRERNIWRL